MIADSMTSDGPGAEWTIVLARDGTVLAASDGAPSSWIGVRLVDAADVSEDVKNACRSLLERAYQSSQSAVQTVPLRSGHDRLRLHLIVVDALPVRRRPTDLRSLLRSSLEVLERQARSLDVALTIDVQKDLHPVAIDPDKIAWAVTALVGNALRYVRHGSHTMPGGTVSVRAGASPTTCEMTIEVQDDGPGISPDRVRRLLGPADTGTLTELGLSMVREVVAAHGGGLTIDSSAEPLHSGTTIRLTLPVAAASVSGRA